MTYSSFAYFYDRLMQDVPYDDWVQFLHKKKEQFQVQGNQLLDLACGTGELSIRFSKANFRVTGVDLSTDMLTVAQHKATNEGLSIPFFQQNMVELEGVGQFDLVTIFCDSLNYLQTEEEVQQTFHRVYNHLRPGGLLLFDVHSLYKMNEIFMDKTFGLNDEDISYVWHSYAGDDEQSVEHELTFFVLDNNTRQYNRFDEYHLQRTFPIETYIHMLKQANFTEIDVNGDFFKETIEETTERVFFTAKK